MQWSDKRQRKDVQKNEGGKSTKDRLHKILSQRGKRGGVEAGGWHETKALLTDPKVENVSNAFSVGLEL